MSQDQYPENDSQFRDLIIESVREYGSGGNGWQIKRSDGFCFQIPADSPVTPVAGMSARFYGEGIGFSVRGVFLAGQKVYYRTEDEDKQYQKDQFYPRTALEALARWDSGDSVFTVSMGGLGPGYEQCIHIMAFEIIRVCATLKDKILAMDKERRWKVLSDSVPEKILDVIGPSGAQMGAAVNLAWIVIDRGWQAAITDPAVKDRLIQVSKNFPVVT